MERLKVPATKILIRFVDMLKYETEIDITLADHSPLRLVKGRKRIYWGKEQGRLFSLGQMWEIEQPSFETFMVFMVIDKREEEEGWVIAFPVLHQDDRNGVREESCRLIDGFIDSCDSVLQRVQADFAYTWLLELQTAGYL
jgi:hypothetical protein